MSNSVAGTIRPIFSICGATPWGARWRTRPAAALRPPIAAISAPIWCWTRCCGGAPNTATQGLAAFIRVGGVAPNRNLMSLEVDAGLTYKGLFPGRELDLLGVAVSYGRIGNAARRLDQDEIRFTGIGGTIRDYEAVLEITYQARVAPWWTLQPDFQMIAHPGGHVAPPLAASSAPPIPNALVLGLRSSILF